MRNSSALATFVLCFATFANSKTVVEYRDSSDFYRVITKNLRADENYIINLKEFGWNECDIKSNESKTINAKCYTDKNALIMFDCHPQEGRTKVYFTDPSGGKMAVITLICAY
jgi:hypothetical protein